MMNKLLKWSCFKNIFKLKIYVQSLKGCLLQSLTNTCLALDLISDLAKVFSFPSQNDEKIWWHSWPESNPKLEASRLLRHPPNRWFETRSEVVVSSVSWQLQILAKNASRFLEVVFNWKNITQQKYHTSWGGIGFYSVGRAVASHTECLQFEHGQCIFWKGKRVRNWHWNSFKYSTGQI